jgi:hypothetical protein
LGTARDVRGADSGLPHAMLSSTAFEKCLRKALNILVRKDDFAPVIFPCRECTDLFQSAD